MPANKSVQAVSRGQLRVQLTGAAQAREVLEAELGLVRELGRAAAAAAARADQAHVQAWINNYWVKALDEHATMTQEWLNGIDAPDSPTLQAAKTELELAGALMATLEAKLAQYTGQPPVVQATIQSWLNDLAVEAQSDEDFVAALGGS